MSQSHLNSPETLLKRLEEQKFALDQSAIVAQTDIHGTINYVNDKFCEISGYSREELIGQNHRIINSGTHPKDFFRTMWSTISSGKVWKGEICNRSKSGNLYWVATTIVPLLNEQNQPHRYLSIRQDITQLKQAQQVIAEQQAQMMASSKLSAIGEMAATITHEINNPLGVILGRCEMMKTLIATQNVDVKNLERLVDTIDVTAKRIEKIVRSMKTLSHEGNDEPKEKVLVSSIIEALDDLFSEKFRAYGIQYTITPFDLSLFLECRDYEILQVMVNLLNNAFDAIVAQQKKWIRIDVKKTDSTVEISVMDSGPGVPAPIVEKLFMPFFSTKKVQYGTGLGLSISRSLMIRHGGQLEYDEQSPFTRFVLTLPN